MPADRPGPLGNDPNQLRAVTSASPASGIELIEPPQANSRGEAALTYPLTLPQGRNGMEPQLSVDYNSSHGNGWLGVGWDLALPAVTIDTRWGVPRYDAASETETYLLDGEQLTPDGHRGPPVARSAEKQFAKRVEGTFERIIRHGAQPSNYWWEVIARDGTRYLYGDDPASAGSHTLRDGAGNINRWALREVRDPNGNFVTYSYERVIDAGVAGSTVAGVQLYPREIRYTGHGADAGAYAVRFVRDRDLPGFTRRQDVIIEARGGFKQVTADLLRRVEVTFQGQPVRSWDLEYETGAFSKTLLKAIRQRGEDGSLFNSHEFAYYQDPLQFGAPVEWQTGDDGVAAPIFDISIPELGLNGRASGLSGSISTGGGGHIYLGFNPTSPTKVNSVGGKIGFNYSENEGVLELMDLNGDGLPDKVFKGSDGNFRVRLNQSGPDGTTVFGPAHLVSALPALSKEQAIMISLGAEAYPGPAEVSLNEALTFTIGATYFSDVNGDGLPDLVSNGQVLFNHLDSDGVPTYSTDSGATPVPIAAGGSVDSTGVVADNEEAYQKQVEGSPLLDPLRRWVAPYDGTIKITGSASLIQDTSPQRSQYQTADGVRVAIQQNGSELWSTTIAADDYSPKTPSGVDGVPVLAGDRLYFRVQSVFDGKYDQVAWDPEITYVGMAPALDANGLDAYRYKASTDFVLAGQRGIGAMMPLNGTVQLSGNFVKKGVTTDDVTVVVAKNGTPLLTHTLGWDETGSVDIGQSLVVAKDDMLQLHIQIDSPIDLRQLEWAPGLAYLSTTDQDANGNPIYVQDNQGRYLITQSLPYDIDSYAVSSPAAPQAAWVAPETGSLTVVPQLTATPNATGAVAFTVKRQGALLAKRSLSITGGAVTGDPITVDVTAGESLYFDYSTTDPDLMAKLSDPGAQLTYGSQQATATATLHTIGSGGLFAPPYRGWAYAGYDGNLERATAAIDESLLVSPSTSMDGCSADGITDPEQIPSGCGPGGVKAHIFVPTPAQTAWTGPNDRVWIRGGSMSSSRLGAPALAVPRPEQMAGARAVSRIGFSAQTAISAGVSVVGASAAYGRSLGLLDYLDLNGDGFPDVVGNGRVQYTTPLGGLEADSRSVAGLSDVRESENVALSLSVLVSGNPASSKSNAQGAVGTRGSGSPKGNKSGKQMAQLGISGSLGGGNSKILGDLIDMNGDGLLDRVFHESGHVAVALNLGYGFGQTEIWGEGAIDEGASRDYSLGVSPSFNAGRYDFAGGISVSKTESRAACRVLNPLDGSCLSDAGFSLIDLNGDGLPDRVRPGQGGLRVAFNTGNGFAAETFWGGALQDAVAIAGDTSTGGGVYFTVGVGPLCIAACYLIINPGFDISQGLGRQELALIDVNGDGYLDHVSSTENKRITVAPSQIGRTHLLKRISRPLGSTIDLEYQRDGNTPEQPHSRWVLSRTQVDDGHPGDGADLKVNTFRYEGGFYSRLEREFYGYRTVITEVRGAAQEIYRTITSEYHNDSIYTRGLLRGERLQDGAGRPFLEVENLYAVRNVETGSQLLDLQSQRATGFPHLIRQDRRFFEAAATSGKSTYITYVYNDLGLVTRKFDAGDAGGVDDVLTTISYSLCMDSYVIEEPTAEIRTDEHGNVLRRREASVDCATGNVTQEREYVDEHVAATTDYAYFPNGNLLQVTMPANAAGQRYQSTYEYDPVVQTYAAAETDSFGYRVTTTYNLKYGAVATTTDINQNPTSYTYDRFGRPESVTGPYEQGGPLPTLRYEYHPDATVPWALTRRIDPLRGSGATIDQVLFTDGLGREIQSKQDATLQADPDAPPQDLMIVSGRVTFDAVGRAVEAYYPVTEPMGNPGVFNSAYDNLPPTRTAYDVLDRTIQITRPDGTQEQIGFGFGPDRLGVTQFETTTIDGNGKISKTYQDVSRRITSVKQFNRNGADVIWTSYDHDPLNQLVVVTDDKGNKTTATYDLLGRRTSIRNPDTGLVEYRYDQASNLIERVTPNLRATGRSIEYRYDFNRLAEIRHPGHAEIDVHYAYGAPGAGDNGAGRIIKVDDQSGSLAYRYGKLGEVVGSTRTVAVAHGWGGLPPVYTTGYVYDSQGRLAQLTYPDGEVVTYTYDRGGALRQVTGEQNGQSRIYVSQIGYDKFGERTFSETGNRVRTRYSYDPATRFMTGLASGTPQGLPIQNRSYTHDRLGNILSIENQVPAPGYGPYGSGSVQTYQYDDLYRLTGASGEYETGEGSKVRQYSLSLTYDSIDNILTKQQTDQIPQGKGKGKAITQQKTTYSFNYAYGGAQPHAPTHLDNRSFTYDANGNQLGWTHDLNGTRRNIIWDEEDRIQSLFENGREFAYTYDSTGERVIKRGEQGEIAYVNPHYTVRNGDVLTKHVFAGTERVASKLVEPGLPGEPPVESQFFYLADHQGSTQYVTDEVGQIREHLEYFPFGETWVQESTYGQKLVNYYTGQEFDSATGLYYYGARYYDPRISVWESPDPVLDEYMDGERNGGVYVPANLDLYGYVGEDPVNHTDPDGKAKGGAKAPAKGKAIAKGKVSKKIHKIYMDPKKYPESVKHIKEAIKAGHPKVLTVARGMARANRKLSLKGIKTKPGKDRDEYPFAMTKEGGKGAHIKLIGASDNRGSGSSMGSQTRGLKDGDRYMIVFK